MTDDGNLPAARTRFENAVLAFTDPQPHTVNGAVVFTDSRYDQLRAAVAGQSAERSGGASSLPIWPEAFDLLVEVDTMVRAWWRRSREPASAGTTVDRLTAVLGAGWRPQDVATVNEHSGDVERWVKKIDSLLSEEHHSKHLAAPCPACGVRTVRRHNGAEWVRQPALHIDGHGCHCLACHHRWAPEYFQHLARVIGCPTPTGVLE